MPLRVCVVSVLLGSGRGEARFALAMASLSKGFDGRAVEHISQALADLTE